ncbi:uncharacterized protein LOC144158075 [Haemaphysalis longicornis]
MIVRLPCVSFVFVLSTVNLKPVPVMLLVAFAFGVQGQDLSPRTFGFFPSHFADQQGYHNAHPHQHGSNVAQAQGHHTPVPSGQDTPIRFPSTAIPATLFLSTITNMSINRPSPATGNANTVPELVCRVAHVPAPSSSGAGSVRPPVFFENLSTSLETVLGRVMDPVVALLHNASVWLNRTAHCHPGHSNHAHQHHSHTSSVAAVHQKVMALTMHKNPMHPGFGRSPVAHATATGSPDRFTPTTVAATQTCGRGRKATTAPITPSRVPAHALASTVGAPAPRLFTEPSPTPEAIITRTCVTFGASNSSTEQSPSSEIPSSVAPSASEAISVQSAPVFTTQPPTTVNSAPSSTQAEPLFQLTPRAQSTPSTPELCMLLTIRCEPGFRRRLCYLYEQCLLNGTRPRRCLEALTSVVSSDEGCTRA